MEEPRQDEALSIPWQQSVFDTHCHPTDTMSSIEEIPNMKARVLTIMATRREDQDLVNQVAERFPYTPGNQMSEDERVATQVIPSFGWHPWFSYQLYDDREISDRPDRLTHYESVLIPDLDDPAFVDSLPEPKSLTEFLDETETRLRRHPHALVGEVGLDKSFRLPKEWTPVEHESRDSNITSGSREGRLLSPYKVSMAHQKVVLEAQLQLAAKLGRPVSMHSVQAHGAVYEVLQGLWTGHERVSGRQRKRRGSVADAHVNEYDDEDLNTDTAGSLPFPPRVCMHSYSGPADFLREFVHRTVPVDIYFSFSETINFSPPSKKNKIEDVIRAVPESRLLMESDRHMAGETMDGVLEDILQRLCTIRNWSPEAGVKILRQNWHNFVFGSGKEGK